MLGFRSSSAFRAASPRAIYKNLTAFFEAMVPPAPPRSSFRLGLPVSSLVNSSNDIEDFAVSAASNSCIHLLQSCQILVEGSCQNTGNSDIG